MITLDLSILNQKGTPMFNSDIFANRPTFGIVGRIFISTDTAAIYRDTGTAWDLISDATGAGTNIYNSDGTLTGNRTVSSGNFSLTFNPATTFDTTLTAANNASSLSIFGVNRLSYAAGFSANNIGALYGGTASFGLQTFAGSATFANSNIASGGASINSIDFSSAGSTITITQSSGIRAMTGNQVQVQYQGTNSGTITHAAISQNLGFYRPSGASGTLTITNAYSHLINALDDYGAGFTFTNRWGIYQDGASDTNYFAANMLLGSVVDDGNRLQITGNTNLNGNLIISGNTRRITALFSGGPAIDRTHFQNITTNSDTFVGFLPNGTGSSSGIQIYNNSDPTNSTALFLSAAPTYLRIQSLVRGTGTHLPIEFSNNNVVCASIQTNGNLLVGTSVDSGQRLQISGNVYFTGKADIGLVDILSSSTSSSITASCRVRTAVTMIGAEITMVALTPTSGTITIPNMYGFKTNIPVVQPNVTVNNSYGIYISRTDDPVSGGVVNNKYSLVTESTAGNFGICTTSPSHTLTLNGSLRIDGQQSATSGGNSGQHLIINLDGTTYKIKLELP